MTWLSGQDIDRCVTEVAVLSACRHVNIVRYIQAYVSDEALHIVMEYATGGENSNTISFRMSSQMYITYKYQFNKYSLRL